jgi:hypothetical protein
MVCSFILFLPLAYLYHNVQLFYFENFLVKSSIHHFGMEAGTGKKFFEISDEIFKINDFWCGTRKLNLVQIFCLYLNKIIFVMLLE